MKTPNSAETPQRTATRAPIDKPIRLQFDDAAEVLEGRCRNISIGGVFVELAVPQAHGSLARFELVLGEDESIRGLGEVVWARSGDRSGGGKAPGIGIKFRFLEQRDRQRIFKLVSQHIKDRLANRPSMTASPEAPTPAVRPGMVFQPPEGGAPSVADLAAPSSALPVAPGPSKPKPPSSPLPAAVPGPPAAAERPVARGNLAAPPASSLPPSPLRVPAESELRDRPAASVAPDASDLPVVPPPAAPSAAGPAGAEEVTESVLEALPPLEPVEPQGPGDEIWAEPPPAGRRISAPPDDEPTLSSWNLEDASLDPPAPGSVLAEADSVIGRDPALLGELDSVSDAPLQEPGGEASIPPPSLSFDATYPGDEPLDEEEPDLGRKPAASKRPAWLLPALGIAGLLALGIGFFWESRSSEAPGTSPPPATVPMSGAGITSPEGSDPLVAGAEEASGQTPEELEAAPAVDREPATPPRNAEAPPPAPRQSPPPPAASTRPSSPPPTSTAGFRRLLGIDWETAPGGLLLSFSLDGEITADRYRHFRLGGDPAREVIQFRGIEQRFARNQMAVGGPGVEQLRIGFHRKSRGDEIHVVLDMQDAQARVSDITAAGSQLLVRISTDS